MIPLATQFPTCSTKWPRTPEIKFSPWVATLIQSSPVVKWRSVAGEAFGLAIAGRVDAHPGAIARRGSGDGCDAVFGGQGEQFGGWSTRLLFAALPLADDPRGHIQMSREDGLAHRRFGADAANGGRREFHDWGETCVVEFAHGLAVNRASLMQVRHAFMQRRECFARVCLHRDIIALRTIDCKRLRREKTCAAISGKSRILDSTKSASLHPLHSPNLAQIASILALVARSISIMAGQGRVKPSACHFLVASMPILEP